jgi:hypothetical protein
MNKNPKPQEKSQTKSVVAQSADDYARNMFKDGHNRAEHNPLVANAPDYDAAVNLVDEYTNIILQQAGYVQSDEHAHSPNTGYSRDGTGSSGRDDEDGGHIGGTEKELDSLEISNTPVDKHSNIKQ